jgi:serine/threonine protein kinase
MKKDLWRRAEEIFHAALERPPEARRAFLDEACGEDTELRRQVEMLVSKDENAGSFLEKPALADATAISLAGKHYGTYHILSLLGAGGMGEVYRAHDSKLGRDVAIKTLPPEFARDPDRVARFQREAKLLASLNHPNIAAIYGLDESGGTQFLVLELVEGETLAGQIKRGPIPVEESLKLALQIAEALESAHEKGVIHRDLKPANIKVTSEGNVKVLDFGLAKAFAGEQAEVNLSNSPTLSNAATQQGVILGTAAYMSPEQARGKSVDKRTDIWAFGCVLYEMLTGRVAFQGDDVGEILASVIKGDVKLDLLPAKLHPRVREVLIRCLQKDLKKRYHDIADARYEIEQVLADPGGVLVQPVITAAPERKLRRGLLWKAATAILSVAIGGVAVWKFTPTEPRPVIRFDYELPKDHQFSATNYSPIAVSPDGKQFVYSTSKGLYMRSLDESAAKLIAGTEGDTRQPFFSPDGKWIGYWSVTDGRLKKIAVNGGPSVPLCNAGFLGQAWWNEEDTIIYSDVGVLMRISANGGTPESIAKRKDRWLSEPQILPDGKSLMYTASPKSIMKIMVQSKKSGETKEFFRGETSRYLPTGHLIYMSDNDTLLAVPFSLDRLEPKGGPVSVLEGVMHYAISESGTLAYMPRASGGVAPGRTLVWVNREGKEEPLSAAPDQYSTVRISPDGKRVALTVGSSPKGRIWIWDVDLENMTPLTLDKGIDNLTALWTLDGKRIVYTSSREDVLMGNLYWKASDGTGEAELLASLPGRGLFPWSWSKDGKSLLLTELSYPLTLKDIGMLSMEGNRTLKPLLQEGYSEDDPRISPDGRWMAYRSNESGRPEVYVRPFPDVNKGKWKVSTNGGNSPLWSPDSRELFYRSGDDAMAVRVETNPEFKPGKPTVLFRGAYSYIWDGMPSWDIGPDGRFLMMKEAAAEAPRKINIVVNWFEELKRRVPAK